MLYMCEYVEPNLGNEKYLNKCTCNQTNRSHTKCK